MLGNNNKKILDKLAKNTLRRNKKQMGILFLTICLSAFMLFSVFTLGITYLDLSRQQDTRLNGVEYDIALMNGFTEQQKESLEKNSFARSIGIESYAGYIKSTEYDNTVDTGLLWCDQTFWEEQMAPARTKTEGFYPQEKDQLMVTREGLKALGKEDLQIGDRFFLTYEDNTGIHTGEFVISGIWDGYGDKAPVFVSEEFYKQSGYRLENDGILCIKLKQDFLLPGTINKIEDSLGLSERQAFQPSPYIENSLKILAGIWGLCAMICLSAYLLIYNILYLSVNGKIRYYGLLQTLGMTRRQFMLFMKKLMLLICASGIAGGIVLGILTSLVLVPYMMKILGISMTDMKLSFHPSILFVSAAISGTAVFLGIRKPVRTAADISPVEAVKYRGLGNAGQGSRKVRKKNLLWNMALEQIRKNKKKSTVAFLSLAVSLSVFYCLTTIISSHGTRTVAANYWDADLTIRNSTQTAEDINSLKPALDGIFLEDLKKIEGIRELHRVEGAPVTFPEDRFFREWIQNYAGSRPYLSYNEILPQYRETPESFYGMVKGIDEEEFDYLNQILENPVDKTAFLAGEECILYYPGFQVPDGYVGEKNITFSCEGRTASVSIAAVCYEWYYGGTRNIGPNLIISQDYLESLVDKTYTLNLNIKYRETYDENTEGKIRELIEGSPYSSDLLLESKLENMQTIQDSQGDMMEISIVISLLLLLVGVLNYGNTMAASIQSRKLTFAIMESLGMSGRQIRKLLVREGMLYAFFSIAVTVMAGTLITYICFQAVNYTGIPFSVPVLPLLCSGVLVLILCAAVPLLSYKRLQKNPSIVERLREYEE